MSQRARRRECGGRMSCDDRESHQFPFPADLQPLAEDSKPLWGQLEPLSEGKHYADLFLRSSLCC